MLPRVAIMATGAWFDPALAAGEPERHGNPNVLTLDIGTSRLTQGPSALSALVEIERWDARRRRWRRGPRRGSRSTSQLTIATDITARLREIEKET